MSARNDMLKAAASRFLMRGRTPKALDTSRITVPDAPPVAARYPAGGVPPRKHARQPQKGSRT